MQTRIKNPAEVLPEAVPAIQALFKAASSGGVPRATMELAHLRASQINGCGYCVDSGARTARKSGETEERLFAVAAWRDTPYFDDAERAALALAESATRMADQGDAVPDDIWDEAARHFDEKQLSALVLMIGLTNLVNRINVTTRQPASSQSW